MTRKDVGNMSTKMSVGMIEEMLRYGFPPNLLSRTARHDSVFNGHQIKAGQHVVGWANE
jgi:cytochrome P450